MLQTLRDWRAQCNEEKLLGFEAELKPLIANNVTDKTFQQRYQGCYHLCLMVKKFMDLSLHVGEFEKRTLWGHAEDYGGILARHIADHDGCIAICDLDKRFHHTAELFLKRGILFVHQGKYCLPAELVIEKCGPKYKSNFLGLVGSSSLSIALMSVPNNVKKTMLAPSPLANEMKAWLVVEGLKSIGKGNISKLDKKHWPILLSLYQQDITRIEIFQHFYSEFEGVEVNDYYNSDGRLSFRQSLEKQLPEDFKELYRLGLLGIRLYNSNDFNANISLSDEGRALLKPQILKIKKEMARKLSNRWDAKPCDIQIPSAWHWEQTIWQLWVVIKFLKLKPTQEQQIRKSDMKKLQKILPDLEGNFLELILYHMLNAGMLEIHEGIMISMPINWKKWGKYLQEYILHIVQAENVWRDQEEKQLLSLLKKLPIGKWLDLEVVVLWLNIQVTGKLVDTDWHDFFTSHQACALHHINMQKQRIFLLPQFHDAVYNKALTHTAPGWHGAEKKAAIQGFVSAAGEVQLPPDCNHKVLDQLVDFCTLTSIGHMITLQLDEKALQRMTLNKTALKRAHQTLTSLQADLPQAVTYLFDKHLKQKSVGAVAATSMVVRLQDMTALQRLQRLGFELLQPFPEHAEIILLDASADSHAFIEACIQAGIQLETLIKPVQWIQGTASIKAWVGMDESHHGLWVELAYQKTRTTKPKQVYAYVDEDYYGAICVRCVSKTSKAQKLLKSIMLEPKHILRLRILNATEVEELALNALVENLI